MSKKLSVLLGSVLFAAALAPRALPQGAGRQAKSVKTGGADQAAADKSPEAAVYRAMQKAIAAEDLTALKRTMDSKRVKQIEEDPNAKKMIALIKMMSPTDVKFLKLSETGDTAILAMSGAVDGKPQSGYVKFTKEGGAWKVSEESWKGQ